MIGDGDVIGLRLELPGGTEKWVPAQVFFFLKNTFLHRRGSYLSHREPLEKVVTRTSGTDDHQ